MGNSNGTLAEYWDAIESTPGLQGGFIWEWRDHGLEQRLPDGTIRHAYGGDFGDKPNDGMFCIDGITFPDRSPKPAIFEHMALASPVRAASDPAAIAAAREGRVTLENRGGFRDARLAPRDLGGLGRRGVDGVRRAAAAAIAAGRVRRGRDPGLRAPRGRRRRALADAALPHGRGRRLGGGRLRDRLGAGGARRRRSSRHRARRTTQGWTGDVAIDDEGYLLHPSFAAPPALSLWRAPTDNDRIGGMGGRWAAWGLPSLTRRLDGIERAADAVTVRATWTTATGLEIGHTQRLAAAGGRIRVEETVEVPAELDDLPRVGTVLELAAGHEAFEWFGRGPARDVPGPGAGRAGRAGGRRPSPTSSCRTSGRRRTAATPTRAGSGSARRAAGSASTSTGRARSPPPTRPPPTSTRRRTTSSCGPRPETIVHIDAAHRGLGTASCGPDTLEPYVLRRRHLPLGLDAERRGGRGVTIDWDAAAREWHLENGRVASRCACSRTAGSGHLHAGAPAATRRLPAAPRPADSRATQPGRRAGRARGPGAGRRRLPGPGAGRRGAGRLDRPRPRGTRSTGSSPASRSCPASRRRTPRRTTRRRRSRSTSSTRRRACGSRVRTRCSRTAPVVARSLTLANGGGAPLTVRCAMSAVLDLPDADWKLVTLSGTWARERHVYERPLVPGRQSVGQPARARAAPSTARSSPCAARRRPRTPARPAA